MNHLAIDCSYMTHNRQYITPVGAQNTILEFSTWE